MVHCIRIALVVCLLGSTADVCSQTLVWLPSVAVDQRFDDNYRLIPGGSESVSATRLVANLGLNRESAVSRIRGLLRADALLSVGQNTPDELDSNQYAFLESNFTRPRSSSGVRFNFKKDTPNRDIATDITDITAIPSDSGAAVTQNENVDRERFVFNPEFSYNLSRRSELSVDYTYTQVEHGLRSCSDAFEIYTQALANNVNNPSTPGPSDVFKTSGELDDFKEHAVLFGFNHRLSLLSSFSVNVGYSRFEAEEESDEGDENEIEDPDCKGVPFTVRRDPRRETSVDTARLTVGYDRNLSETLSVSGQFGFYVADSTKLEEFEEGQPAPRFKNTSDNGYLFNLSIVKRSNVTTYRGKIGIEVFPSDVGDVVESLNIEGDLTRKINPLLDFNFRIRAFEPDTISDENNEDDFARRFLSIEPKLVWRFSRVWTVGGSFRYRRQKSQTDVRSSESNALLLSLKYTPSSELGDLAR